MSAISIKTPDISGGETKTPTAPIVQNEERKEEYTDIRKVTISLVENYSLYRKANIKMLPKRVDYIGSSINSSRTLAANKQEVETYFPNILGLSPNNEKFITGVKTWLNNIRVAVDQLGKTLDISFHYYDKKMFEKFRNREADIDKEFESVNRNDLEALKRALDLKVNKLNALESEKCQYGYPLNVEEYLIYRHCLLYHDVAKDTAVINSDNSIRFYFKDNTKEAEKVKKYREQVVYAKKNYVAALGDDELFNAVYIQYCLINNLPITASLAEDEIEKQIKLDKFSQDEPLKFNKIFNNKDVKLIAQIELLIAKGELIRSDYNQQITSADGKMIGANMNEALAWFKNPENITTRNAYMARLKNA